MKDTTTLGLLFKTNANKKQIKTILACLRRQMVTRGHVLEVMGEPVGEAVTLGKSAGMAKAEKSKMGHPPNYFLIVC